MDVKCKDESGRIFIVEIQIDWTTYFMERMLFNASCAYVKQIKKGESYEFLRPVYGLALLADNFEHHSNEWYHHYKMVNIQDTNKEIKGLQLVFIELKKFKAIRFNEKKLQVLWLRFMSEIDEKTRQVAGELLEVKEIKEAVQLLEESAYTPEELEYYHTYWDSVSSEKTLMEGKFREGKEEGREETLNQVIQAQKMLKEGISIEEVSKITGLPLELLSFLL